MQNNSVPPTYTQEYFDEVHAPTHEVLNKYSRRYSLEGSDLEVRLMISGSPENTDYIIVFRKGVEIARYIHESGEVTWEDLFEVEYLHGGIES